eukprot:9070525-Heterocapsa_arctica.AAC.1
MAKLCQGRNKQCQTTGLGKGCKKQTKQQRNGKGVDEFTTRKLYNFLSQKQPMHAGALHTIITDGAWYPQRAATIAKHSNGKSVLREGENAGLQHI